MFKSHQPAKTLTLTALACYLFVFMEWLFFVSKPSFLINLTVFEHLFLLLTSPLPIIVFLALLLLPLFVLMFLAPGSKFSAALEVCSLLVPAAVLAFLGFLMVENFTYTLWNFNIGSFSGNVRYFYAVGIAALIVWLVRFLWRLGQPPAWPKLGFFLRRSAIVLMAVSCVLGIVGAIRAANLGIRDVAHGAADRPNILVLSTDGLNASHMSAYGYARETTPFIDSLIPQSLLVQNHFANNAKSTGSIGAFFSGKLPTKTRVIYPPDIFRGIDSYQHMPAVLKKLGYTNADFSIRHYTDPYDLNMRDGFDQANGRHIGQLSDRIELPGAFERTFVKESYFLETVMSRLITRLQHALAINDMRNPYLEVTNLVDAKRHFPDAERIAQLMDFMDGVQNPFFAHVHLMVTHGTKFHPRTRVFSAGQTQDEHWMTDFYDDTIRDFDRMVGEVVDFLKKRGLYENTLLILTSDHGTEWSATERIPLILRFPGNRFAGVRRHNTQRIDVTASIIDYLGLEKPEWIEGESFLGGELGADRPIYFADSITWGPQNSAGWRDTSSYAPPFFSLGGVGFIVAQNWYFLNLVNRHLRTGHVEGHTSPVEPELFPSKEEAQRLLVDHLQANGYAIEGLSD
jgi:arylsulfatase A-like enzyme